MEGAQADHIGASALQVDVIAHHLFDSGGLSYFLNVFWWYHEVFVVRAKGAKMYSTVQRYCFLVSTLSSVGFDFFTQGEA